jgi:hypothetical protein
MDPQLGGVGFVERVNRLEANGWRRLWLPVDADVLEFRAIMTPEHWAAACEIREQQALVVFASRVATTQVRLRRILDVQPYVAGSLELEDVSEGRQPES